MHDVPPGEPGDVRTVRTNWDDVVVVCRKCQKRMGGGFGPDGNWTLRKAIRKRSNTKDNECSIGVIQAGCFGVCPKQGVTVMRASRPSELLVVTPESFNHLFRS